MATSPQISNLMLTFAQTKVNLEVPDDVIVIISLKSDLPELSALLKTCKALNRIVQSNDIWNVIAKTINYVPLRNNNQIYKKVCVYLSRLRNIAIEVNPINHTHDFRVAKQIPTIRSFNSLKRELEWQCTCLCLRMLIGDMYDREGNLLEDYNLSAPSFNAGLAAYAAGPNFHMRELDLKQKQLILIPFHIGLFSRLTHIDLRSNYLETIPATFGKLVNLRVLLIAQNPLKRLPITLRNLNETRLDIDLNEWREEFQGSEWLVRHYPDNNIAIDGTGNKLKQQEQD